MTATYNKSSWPTLTLTRAADRKTFVTFRNSFLFELSVSSSSAGHTATCNTNSYIKWALGLRMEKRPPYMDGSSEYTE